MFKFPKVAQNIFTRLFVWLWILSLSILEPSPKVFFSTTDPHPLYLMGILVPLSLAFGVFWTCPVTSLPCSFISWASWQVRFRSEALTRVTYDFSLCVWVACLLPSKLQQKPHGVCLCVSCEECPPCHCVVTSHWLHISLLTRDTASLTVTAVISHTQVVK